MHVSEGGARPANHGCPGGKVLSMVGRHKSMPTRNSPGQHLACLPSAPRQRRRQLHRTLQAPAHPPPPTLLAYSLSPSTQS